MTLYNYIGQDASGASTSGTIEGKSEEVVASELVSRGITPIDIKKSHRNVDLGNWIAEKISGPGYKLEDLIFMCRQLYSLNKAGIPILNALNAVLSTQRKPVLAEALKKTISGIESGMPLSIAMAQSPKVFSSIIVNMVHVGENTGRLDEVFRQIASYLYLEKNTLKKLKETTRYPLTVISFIMIAILIVNYYVVPTFASMFERMGSDLPLPTKILIFSSNIFVNYWWVLLVGSGTLLVMFWNYISTDHGRYSWDKLKFRVPLLGSIIRRVLLTRFTRVLSMLLKEGVSILPSLRIVADAMGNFYFSQSIQQMHDRISRGEGFTKAASSTDLFNPVVIQMVSVGEESGSIDAILEEIAEFYEEEVEYDLKRFSDALEPLLVILMGIMVLILALGVFLPLWDLGAVASKA